MKTLTPAEIEKLPSCLFDRFSFCPESNYPDIPILFCLENCTLPDMKRAITRENMGVAMGEFYILVSILVKMGVLKDADKV